MLYRMFPKLLLRLMDTRTLKCIGKSCNMHLIRNMSGKEKYPSLYDLKIALSKQMGVQGEYDPKRAHSDRSHLLQYLPKSQDELPKRSMKDSFIVGLVPLSSDIALQNKYVTFLGRIRVGRLLEDMDIFSVMVAFKHIENPKQPKNEPFAYTLVTALVDKIEFTDFHPEPKDDIKISGHVSWVGKSSLEVVVWLEQEVDGVWKRITRALFVLAARNSTNTASAIVNPIVPADDEEKQVLSGGESRKEARIENAKRHISKVIPDQSEQSLIYDLYIKSTNVQEMGGGRVKTLPPDYVWMADWKLSNNIFSHPEERNRHNAVFGGFIMRQAVELGWTLGYMYSKHRPVLKTISDINFQKSVAVGSLAQMHAYLVFTENNFIQISVYAVTFDPISGKSQQTNTFHFTFTVPELVKKCVPLTYHEAMLYLDGRRHFLNIMKQN